MNWRDYEAEVYEAIASTYLSDTVIRDHKIRGQFSGRSRQIDIYIEQRIGDTVHRTVIDCKKYKGKVGIKRVESIISMVRDVGADHGIIISELGFTKTAYTRAFRDPQGVELDTYTFNEIRHHLQAGAGIPYSGSCGALVRAPLGWVIDGKRSDYLPSPATFYKRGLTIEQAFEAREFAYVDFWNTDQDPLTVRALSDRQLEGIIRSPRYRSHEQEALWHPRDHPGLLRTTRYTDGLCEVASLVAFPDCILFFVCLTPELLLKRAQRKVRLTVRYALPLGVRDSQAPLAEGSSG